MNGEMYQTCSIVAAAKKALIDKQAIKFLPQQYVNSIVFHYLPKKTLFGDLVSSANNVEQWYKKCIKTGLCDIKFLTPIEVSDRGLLGFSNATPNSIICFYKKERVTYFTSQWEFDSVLRVWDIIYTEHLWDNPPQGKPQFADNTEAFVRILEDISDLAIRIDCTNFSNVFLEAKDSLINTRTSEITNSIPLPLKHKCLFEAASKADVFGAMGSWNDSPPYMAHEKGLDREYDELSGTLLKELRRAVLYAVNEW